MFIFCGGKMPTCPGLICLHVYWLVFRQINQMFVGVAICIASGIYMRDPTCAVVPEMVPWCAAMYATYLYFFV
eukprot:38810-Eustigmatos_ZCMA.PRE.1